MLYQWRKCSSSRAWSTKDIWLLRTPHICSLPDFIKFWRAVTWAGEVLNTFLLSFWGKSRSLFEGKLHRWWFVGFMGQGVAATWWSAPCFGGRIHMANLVWGPSRLVPRRPSTWGGSTQSSCPSGRSRWSGSKRSATMTDTWCGPCALRWVSAVWVLGQLSVSIYRFGPSIGY